MVLGTPEIDRLYAAAQAAEEMLRNPVNATVFTVEERASNGTGFAETVRTGHQVEVVG